jgi:RND family efflux transporter MFP subunit
MKFINVRLVCAASLVGGLINTIPELSAAVSVKTAQPQSVTLRKTTSQPASVRAFYVAELHAKVAGYADVPQVDIGAVVKAGQELLVVQVPEMAKAYERSEAEVTRLDADITRAEAAEQVAAAQVQQATSDIEKSTAQVAADQSEFDRADELVKTGVVTGKVKDEAENRLRAAKAQLSSIKQNLNVARANANAAAADTVASQAAALVAFRATEEIKVMMEYSSIKAPFAGVVTHRNVAPGDLVRNSAMFSTAKPLFVLAKTDVLRISVAVPERDAVWVDQGDPAKIKFSALPGKVFKGAVARTAGSLDPQTRSLAVEIDLPNKDGALLPGMYGTVVITMSEKTALIVPADTIRFDATGANPLVYLVQNGSVSLTPVTVGSDDGHSIEILAGLKEGDQIVTGMLGRLADGQSVTVLAD